MPEIYQVQEENTQTTSGHDQSNQDLPQLRREDIL
jgi:hypothetical protein